MAVETKRRWRRQWRQPATASASGSRPGRSGPGAFYNDVRTEMRKVTAPSLKEVRATTAVVIVTVFLFGVYFWVVDNVIGAASTTVPLS